MVLSNKSLSKYVQLYVVQWWNLSRSSNLQEAKLENIILAKRWKYRLDFQNCAILANTFWYEMSKLFDYIIRSCRKKIIFAYMSNFVFQNSFSIVATKFFILELSKKGLMKQVFSFFSSFFKKALKIWKINVRSFGSNSLTKIHEGHFLILEFNS